MTSETTSDLNFVNYLTNYLQKIGVLEWWRINYNLYIYCNNDIKLYEKGIKILYILYKYLPFIFLLRDIVISILAKLVYRLFHTSISSDSNNSNKILFIANPRWRKDKDPSDSSKIRLTFPYYNNITQNLPKEVTVEYIYNSRWSQNIVTQYPNILKYSKINCKHLMRYWTIDVWRLKSETKKQIQNLSKKVDGSEQDIAILAKLTNKSVSSVKTIIKYSILVELSTSIRYEKLVTNCINKEHPCAVFLINEQNGEGRIWSLVTSDYMIPIIGLQHGIIHYSDKVGSMCYGHNGYYAYNREFEGIPIPDVTLVWGEDEYYYLITESGYPKERVRVVGSPGSDMLYEVHEKYSRDEFCSRNNIELSKKLILWLTSTHVCQYCENTAYLQTIFQTISNLENVVLIIKQHPAEKQIHRDLINKYISQFHLDIIIPDKNANTTELIYVSDIVILKDSTAGQEVIALHKPLLVMDFSEIPDAAEYVKWGVAEGVYNHTIFKKKLIDLLYNYHDIRNLQDEYIRWHLGKIDGCAAKRCTDVIMEYMNH